MWVVDVQIGGDDTLVITTYECQVVIGVTLVVELTYQSFCVHVGLLPLVQFSVQLEGCGKFAQVVVAQNLLQVQTVDVNGSSECLVGCQVHVNLGIAGACVDIGL